MTAASAARVRYVVGDAKLCAEALDEVAVLDIAVCVVAVPLELVVGVVDEAELLVVDVALAVEAVAMLVLELDGLDVLVEVDALVLLVVDVLEVLVVAAVTKVAASASGPCTKALVVADVGSAKVVFPLLETQPEKRKPALALAVIVTLEEALNQFEPEGLAAPASWGDTASPTAYWRA